MLPSLRFLSDLTDLWISGNKLDSIEAVGEALRHNRRLDCIYLEHNPLHTAQRDAYMRKVKMALPWVTQIDAQ